jgi:Tfp pilus assembly protein PilF
VQGIWFGGCAKSPHIQPRAEDHYLRAQKYFGNNSDDAAEQEIRQALQISAEDPRYLELLALIYQRRGQLRLAEDTYRSALKADKVPPSIFLNYSTVLLKRDRADEAIVFVQRALQEPGYDKPALAHTNLGLAYLKKADLDRAAEHLRIALEYDPSLPEAHYNFGLVYDRMQKSKQAIRAYRDAIRYRSSYVEAYANLGHLLLADGRHDEARDAFEHVIALAPESDLAVASRRQLKLLTPKP